jgi:membrane fusion protein (multidrug efflux system)
VPVEFTPNATTRAIESVTIRARVRGFLTERHFAEGAFVRKGQLLLVIDEEPYKVAMRSARASEALAAAALKKAEQSTMREVAAAQVELDRAQLVLAQVQERRSRSLLSRSAGTMEDLDKTEADRKKWEAQVVADRAKDQQSQTDYEVGIASASAQLEAARAAVRDTELNLGYCRMVAPLDGKIGEARVKVGNLVGPESAGGGAFSELATIQQLDPMGVDIRLSSRELERIGGLIGHGLAVRLTRPGSSGVQEHPYQGEGYFIDNVIDETTSTFLAKARMPNPKGTLLPGEYVKLRLVVDRLTSAVVVPAPAVTETDSGPIVYVVDQAGKVAAQRVVAGQTHAGFRVITDGLLAGVPVIVDGLHLVQPGVAVKTTPALLTREAPEVTKVSVAGPPTLAADQTGRLPLD